MRVKHYYLRNKENAPVITVCIIYDDEKNSFLSRGISICSEKDNPQKKEGRFYAYDRAADALILKENSKQIFREEALEIIEDIERIEVVIRERDFQWDELFDTTNGYDWYKSIYQPIPTKFEKRLMGVK